MQIPITEAKSILYSLVRLAQKGERVTLTRNGRAVACLYGYAPERCYEGDGFITSDDDWVKQLIGGITPKGKRHAKPRRDATTGTT